MTDDKVDRDFVVTAARNNQVSITNCWIDKVLVSTLYEFVVLEKHTLNFSAPFLHIPQDSTAQTHII